MSVRSDEPSLHLLTLCFSDVSFENDYRALTYQLAYRFHIIVHGTSLSLCLFAAVDPQAYPLIVRCLPLTLLQIVVRVWTATSRPLYKAARDGRNGCAILSVLTWALFAYTSFSMSVPTAPWVHGITCMVLILNPIILKTYSISNLGRLAFTLFTFLILCLMPPWLPMSKSAELTSCGLALLCGFGLAYVIEYIERQSCLAQYRLANLGCADDDDVDDEDVELEYGPLQPAVGLPIRRVSVGTSHPS